MGLPAVLGSQVQRVRAPYLNLVAAWQPYPYLRFVVVPMTVGQHPEQLPTTTHHVVIPAPRNPSTHSNPYAFVEFRSARDTEELSHARMLVSGFTPRHTVGQEPFIACVANR
jgi:hypothetical protein